MSKPAGPSKGISPELRRLGFPTGGPSGVCAPGTKPPQKISAGRAPNSGQTKMPGDQGGRAEGDPKQ